MLSITTQEMYDCYFTCMHDLVWDNKEIDGETFQIIAEALASGDMPQIRKLFLDGYTSMLLGSKMYDLEKMVEHMIRVVHEDKTIGILASCEINY